MNNRVRTAWLFLAPMLLLMAVVVQPLPVLLDIAQGVAREFARCRVFHLRI